MIDSQLNEKMTSKVKEYEVRKDIFSNDQFKALGPDGFPPFFKEFWDIVKYDVIDVACDFVRIGKLLKELN